MIHFNYFIPKSLNIKEIGIGLLEGIELTREKYDNSFINVFNFRELKASKSSG